MNSKIISSILQNYNFQRILIHNTCEFMHIFRSNFIIRKMPITFIKKIRVECVLFVYPVY